MQSQDYHCSSFKPCLFSVFFMPSFFAEDICLRQGWASLETWRPLTLSATVAMERSRNRADKSWMRNLMFQRGPHVGGVSGTTLVTNVMLFWCMTETKKRKRDTNEKDRKRVWGGRDRLWENSCESGKSMFLLWETKTCGRNNLKERGLLEIRKKMEGVKQLLQITVQIKTKKQIF